MLYKLRKLKPALFTVYTYIYDTNFIIETRSIHYMILILILNLHLLQPPAIKRSIHYSFHLKA